VVRRSSSGQFVVAGPPRRSPVLATSGEGALPQGWAELEPSTLVLTCERVRRGLYWELQIPDTWLGKVYVVIDPSIPNNQAPTIGARYFTDGWQYRMEVPGWIDSSRLVRGLIQVLLLEFANRGATERSAEIPLWLLEGTTQHLLHSSLADLVIRPPDPRSAPVPVRSLMREGYRPDPLGEARERLQAHAALSFTRMAEITATDLGEETWKTFRASAQVFLAHLLQMPGARQSLIAMLQQLPLYLNWQMAFLEAFAPTFPRMIDVEKWWSVVLVQFTGLDPLNAWPLGVALDKLDELLHPPVLTPSGSNELPRRHKASLQEIIERWDFLRQRVVLQGVIHQLAAVRLQMPPEAVTIADAYRRELGDYLERRGRLGAPRSLSGSPQTSADKIVSEIKAALDRLDQQRTGAAPTPARAASPPPTNAPGPARPSPSTNPQP
jgi:hypothetical protein